MHWKKKCFIIILFSGLFISGRIFFLRLIEIIHDYQDTAPSIDIIRPEYGLKDITVIIRTSQIQPSIIPTLVNTSNHIVVITDNYVAYNLNLPKFKNVEFMPTIFDLMYPSKFQDPLSSVKTKFVFIPVDYPAEISSKVAELLSFQANRFSKDLLIVNYVTKLPFVCMSLKLDLKRWTATYQRTFKNDVCSSPNGSFGIFATTDLLRNFVKPWLQPFPEGLFIEAAARNVKVRLINGIPIYRKKSKEAPVTATKLMDRVELFNKLQIKKVIRSGFVEWYGCTRNTTRCFGTIREDTPEYLIQGRWTPPCCLRVLRETARYVFQTLEMHKVRYWLEGGSLLGAMRNGDIIPWDYDVDVGVYKMDLDNIPAIRELKRMVLQGIKFASVVDKYGYVWETSRPGEDEHFRVQASKMNRLHVDIFPFYSRDSIMTKDTWLPHKQDMEFPESFLKPRTQVLFAGTYASAPNNIRDFLELKFGPGVIENPQYPNPKLISLPQEKLLEDSKV